MEPELSRLQNLAVRTLFSDEPEFQDRLYDSGDTVMGFSAENIEGETWITLSTPGLGQVASYPESFLLERWQDDGGS